MSATTAQPAGLSRKPVSQNRTAPEAVSPASAPASAVTPEHIRTRAYEIYQARNGNGTAGDPASDWLQAERELNGAAPEPSISRDIEVKSQSRGERLRASGK